jgi:hypothetical protein
LDCGRHLRGVVKGGESIGPGTIEVQVLLDVLHQKPQAFAGMVASAHLVDIAKGALNRIGTGTVGW